MGIPKTKITIPKELGDVGFISPTGEYQAPLPGITDAALKKASGVTVDKPITQGVQQYDAPIGPVQGSGTYAEDLANAYDADKAAQIQKGIDETTVSVSDLRAQQEAMTKYGVVDTSMLVKDDAGNYVPKTQTLGTLGEEDVIAGTSDAERARIREEEIEKKKEELKAGTETPGVYKTADEYKRLREEQGIVDDEAEWNALQNEANIIKQELRVFSSTAGEGVSEAGRVGAVSEAERNAMFRMEGLALRETAVVNRINSKNAYVSNMLELGQQDYQNALADYERKYNENYQAIQLYNEDLDEIKTSAMAGLNTMITLMGEKNIDFDSLNPALQSQIKTLELQSGLPAGTMSAFMSAYPNDEIIGSQNVTNADGSTSTFFFAKDAETGEPKIIKTFNLGGAGSGDYLATQIKQAQLAKIQKETSLLGEPTPAQQRKTEEAIKNTEASLPIMQDKVNSIDDLLTSPGFNSRVGTTAVTRKAVPKWYNPLTWTGTLDDLTGAGNQFAAGVHRLVSGLSLDSLIEAKSRGATFGALSDAELQMLANSASSINDWEIVEDGVRTGIWQIDEASFTEELNRIKMLTNRAILQAQGTLLTSDEQLLLDSIFNEQDAAAFFE